MEIKEHYHEKDKPTTYLPLAIIGTIFGCCSPFCIGILIGGAAIWYSSRVNSLFYQNKYIDAAEASKYAKILAFIAIGLGIIGMLYNGYQIKTNPEIMEESQRMAEEIMKSYGK